MTHTLTKVATLIEDNWDQVKQQIHSYWKKLKEEDIEPLTGYNSLLKKLNEVYRISPEELDYKMAIFIDKLELMAVPPSLNELKEVLFQCTLEAKNRIAISLQKSMDVMKESSEGVKNRLLAYTRENPGHALVSTVVATLILRNFLTKKNNRN